jgi:hypothetical protein
MGLVVGKLDALKAATVSGSLPENVNFGIKIALARMFLESNGIEWSPPKAALASTARLDPPAISRRASGFTLLVSCSQ